MDFHFTQTGTVVINSPNAEELLMRLPNTIFRQTGYEYSCAYTPEDCVLTPTFRNMPHRNSFVPEIRVTLSQNKEQQVLQLTARPVKQILGLQRLFSVFSVMFEAFFLLIAVFSDIEAIFLFAPVLLFLFNYFLCKLGTKFTFSSILKGIQKEFPLSQ